MPLTIYNASTYACHDLLRRKEYVNTLVQFVLEEPRVKKDEFPRTSSKLKLAVRSLKRSFRKAGGVATLLKPLDLIIKPSKHKRYLDARKFYKRDMSTLRTISKEQKMSSLKAIIIIMKQICLMLKYACFFLC